MGFLDRVLGRRALKTTGLAATTLKVDVTGVQQPERYSRHDRMNEALLEHLDADNVAELVELEVVGESYRQDALAAIAGPKEPEGKQMFVGVALRCEPANEHDANAVRVEVMGQHLGFLARSQAAQLSHAIQSHCGGALEAQGVIVGGWKDQANEGHYGIRVWLTTPDTTRLEIPPEKLDPRLRKPRTYPTLPGAGPGEIRLSPTQADFVAEQYGSAVTVVSEEHYQPAIVAALPDGWDDRSWPLLVDLSLTERNPHAKHDAGCIAVRIRNDLVGFFTPKMTERFRATIEPAAANASRVTAAATAYQGTKGGVMFWRLKVHMKALPNR